MSDRALVIWLLLLALASWAVLIGGVLLLVELLGELRARL